MVIPSMMAQGHLALRGAFAAALMLALMVAGVGRVMATMPAVPMASVVIAGMLVPVCHIEEGGAGNSSDGAAKPDCCDQCALCTPAILPAPPGLTHPRASDEVAERIQPAPWAPALARRRTPRQSQGPPAA